MRVSSNTAERAERRAALSAFATLALVMAGHAVLETARDALFLQSLPAEQLPWVYLIIAALTFGLAGLESQLARGARPRELLSVFLFGAALSTFALWAVADFVSVASIWLLYVWTGVFGTVAMIHFWLSMSALFNVTQAKRLFGLVGAGALVGAIVGSSLARVVVSIADARALVAVAAACMLAAALAARFALAPGRSEGPRPAPVRVRDALGVLRAEPYVRRVVAFLLLSTIAVTLADYLFKQEVAATIAPGELASFFATFYASLNVVALIVQLALASYLLDRAGVPRTLAILPSLLVAGGLWAALGGGLAAVLFLRGANGALRHSLHRTATEVLFVPLAEPERARAKTVADVVGHRVGQALASLLILLVLALAPHGALAWMIAAAGGITALLALRSRASYLDVFRRQLGAVDRERSPRLPPLDRAALEALIAALDSPRESEALAALEVFREQGRVDLVPALILHHPSPRVARRALSMFEGAGRRDFVATALRVETDDPELRAALLRAIGAAAPDEAVLREALEDPSRRVRATAVVELAALGRMDPREAGRLLDELAGESAAVRRAIAAALAVRPCPRLDDRLRALAADEDLSVRAEAVHAMAVSPRDALLSELLLALRERALRPMARRGLADAGERGLRALIAALDDPSTPEEVRLHIPRSLARFREAAPELRARVVREPDPRVRAKMLRALSSLARREDGEGLDRDEVSALVRAELARCRRLAALSRALDAGALEPTPTAAVLRDLLAEELAHELEQLFRALALRHPGEDFRSIHRGLGGDDPVIRASCEELLSEVLPGADRRALLALVRGERRERAPSRAAPDVPSARDALASIIHSSSEALAAIAASLAAEIGAVALGPGIEVRARSVRSPALRAVLERAAARLARVEEVAHG